jgi:hypothetical protein
MGYDIYSECSYFSCSADLFVRLYLLAKSYGWKPAGTAHPNIKKVETWGGGYISNDEQLVKAKDAQAWGAALKKAMEEAPASTWREIPIARVREFADFCTGGVLEIQ